jgi:hypothetical protein
MLFDAHGWFNYVLDNADAFGFSNITGYVNYQYIFTSIRIDADCEVST